MDGRLVSSDQHSLIGGAARPPRVAVEPSTQPKPVIEAAHGLDGSYGGFAFGRRMAEMGSTAAMLPKPAFPRVSAFL